MRLFTPVAVLLAVLLLAGMTSGQDMTDQELDDQGRWGAILGNPTTPQLAPGEAGELAFNITNPFSWTMENVSLGVEIYRFTSGGTVVPASELENAPVFPASQDLALRLSLAALAPEESVHVAHRVVTSPSTPSGGYFSQGTYSVRFRLAFDGPEGPALLVSFGFFTLEEWGYATRLDVPADERAAYRYVGNLNLSYLAEVLGVPQVDGILEEAAFGVKQVLPTWPFYLLAAASAGAMGLAAYHRWREGRPPNL